MKERIESLEREVMELRVQQRLLQGILEKVLDSIDEVPSDYYMPLWDGRDGQPGQVLTDTMRYWRRRQRELQVAEAQLAHVENKDSDEARYLAKRLESQRKSNRIYEQYINRDAGALIEANIMAEHDWQLVEVIIRGKDREIREEVCSNLNCRARRHLVRTFRDDQVTKDRVPYSNPSPMRSCPTHVLDRDVLTAARRASGDEDIPF